mmetsp:Transcript_14481/g.42185  ORF Transcript_14481/g.42185 Transcript_14481/m.42185 type:complete len:250 (-) Transcript_14481:1357-2106(-)
MSVQVLKGLNQRHLIKPVLGGLTSPTLVVCGPRKVALAPAGDARACIAAAASIHSSDVRAAMVCHLAFVIQRRTAACLTASYAARSNQVSTKSTISKSEAGQPFPLPAPHLLSRGQRGKGAGEDKSAERMCRQKSRFAKPAGARQSPCARSHVCTRVRDPCMHVCMHAWPMLALLRMSMCARLMHAHICTCAYPYTCGPCAALAHVYASHVSCALKSWPRRPPGPRTAPPQVALAQQSLPALGTNPGAG